MSTRPTDPRLRVLQAGAASRIAGTWMLAAFVTGCAGSAPYNYYTLSPVPPAAAAATSARTSAVVAVGLVTLPDYLDRAPVVTRDSAYSLHLADNDYWGGPLTSMVPRVLAQDVALRLPGDRVVDFPREGGGGFDYRITVDASRFEVDADGIATLDARWRIYAQNSPRPLALGDATFRERAVDMGYKAGAAALSATLGDLSDRLTQELDGLRNTAPKPLSAS